MTAVSSREPGAGMKGPSSPGAEPRDPSGTGWGRPDRGIGSDINWHPLVQPHLAIPLSESRAMVPYSSTTTGMACPELPLGLGKDQAQVSLEQSQGG